MRTAKVRRRLAAVLRFSALLSLMAANPSAAQIGYDYLQISYERTPTARLELVDDDLLLVAEDRKSNTVSFLGSISLTENYFVTADLGKSSFDLPSFSLEDSQISASSIDLNTQALAVGYHSEGALQFFAKLGLTRRELSSSFFRSATIGYNFDLGFRGVLLTAFEWEAKVRHIDHGLDDGHGRETGLNGSLRYSLRQNFSLGIFASVSKYQRSWGLNLRYHLE